MPLTCFSHATELKQASFNLEIYLANLFKKSKPFPNTVVCIFFKIPKNEDFFFSDTQARRKSLDRLISNLNHLKEKFNITFRSEGSSAFSRNYIKIITPQQESIGLLKRLLQKVGFPAKSTDPILHQEFPINLKLKIQDGSGVHEAFVNHDLVVLGRKSTDKIRKPADIQISATKKNNNQNPHIMVEHLQFVWGGESGEWYIENITPNTIVGVNEVVGVRLRDSWLGLNGVSNPYRLKNGDTFCLSIGSKRAEAPEITIEISTNNDPVFTRTQLGRGKALNDAFGWYDISQEYN
jgi:hypothetical protein